MIRFETLSSGSWGNCYAVWHDDRCLLLEAGIKIRGIKAGLNQKLSSVDACLITHEHMDHAKWASKIIKLGIPVYMSAGTSQAIDCPLARNVAAGKQLDIKGWTIMPFGTQHDANEPLGFAIGYRGEVLVFATDTYYLRQQFNNVSHWALECNYDWNTLQASISSGEVSPSRAKRVLQSHMSLEHLVDYLQKQDLSSTIDIWLLHGSRQNLDQELAVRTIEQLTGKPVYIAGGDNSDTKS